jgi:methylmalonyl-CoA mutase cobalamin-binding subunit
VAVCVASAAATAAAAGPPVGSMDGASAVAAAAVGVVAAAGRSAVGDDLAVAVVTLWRSAGVGAMTVRLGGSSARVRLGPLLALRLVASLSRCLAGGGWLTLLSTRMK